MSEAIHFNLVDTPEKEFENFCRNRLEGLALTQSEQNMELYREAAERGKNLIREDKEAEQ